ncbi:MAG TPA: phage/plasmid primase, P4 family [Clostridia bacterium]|nr:phage/plasmid primase, P4 family [Clostridia bacterium]
MNQMTFLEAAKQFISLNIPVLPVCAIVDGKPLCGNPKCPGSKHPLSVLVPHGVKNATIDLAIIEQWNAKYPYANIGIATGKNSGVVVLDEDPKNGGDATLEKLIATHGPLPHTPTARTGSGGHHVYLKTPINGIKGGNNLFGGGIDFKSDGGYVVAPPSLHISGKEYEWLVKLGEAPLADVPDWLLAALENKTQAHTSTEGGTGAIPEGERNAKLTSLAGKLRRKGFTQDELEAALRAFNQKNCTPPLTDNEVVAIATSVVNYPVAQFARTAPCSDAGNAELFAYKYGAQVRFDHKKSQWLIWKQYWWEPDTQKQVMLLAKEVARERQDALDGHSGKEARRFAFGSEGKARLDAMLTLAKSEPPISDSGEGWDADPWLMGTPNGVLDLTTGTLRPGKPEDKITKSTDVEFDPNAPCQRWEQFLEEIFDGNRDLIDFIHCAVGYSLSGSTAEQVMFMCYGTGANGKGVFFHTLKDALGAYGFKAPSLLFDLDKRSSIPNDVAALDGKRFAIITEMDESAYLNESRIKELVHGDQMTARFLNKEFFTFSPVAKYWIAVNQKPRTKDDSFGFWRSILLVPFTKQFSGEKADKGLPEKLRAEAAGIFAWAVRGCLEYRKHGLNPPKLVADATAEYKQESDVLSGFLADVCIVQPNASIPAHLLYIAYDNWADAQKLSIKEKLTNKGFGMKMKLRFATKRNAKGTCYVGIGLVAENEADVVPTKSMVETNAADPMHDPAVLQAFSTTEQKSSMATEILACDSTA